jgi:hypothetical protein
VDLALTRLVVLKCPLADSSRIQHLYEDHSDAIPIFGTSKALGHYCPADMGLNAFNYGMDGASFEVTDTLLQIELAKTRTTPVMVELQLSDTESLGDQAKYVPFVSDPRIRALLEQFHALHWWYHIPAIRYFGFYEFYVKNYLLLKFHVVKVSQGFHELTRIPPFDPVALQEFVRKHASMASGYFQTEERQNRLITHIREHPARLFILTIAPYHPCHFIDFKNPDKLAAFKAALSACPNVVILDHSRQAYPEDYWLDTLHLRRPAAAIYSQTVGAEIRQILNQRGLPIPPAPAASPR